MRSVFSTYHPVINFGFFCAVIGIGIFVRHPVFLTIGFVAALIYALMLGGKGTLKFSVCFVLPMILVFTIVNPMVNHRGETVLFYTKYSQITMESTVYGLLSGFMLAAVLLWFSCYNRIMTSDKFVYIFGRIMPAVSLIFSMVMRFVPNFKMQIVKISNAQKCIGRDISSGSRLQRARHGVKILSIMLTWALENAIDSADSMRSRGYGLKDRSTFSIYRFDTRDKIAAGLLSMMTAVVVFGAAAGRCSVEFYPSIVMADFDCMTTIICAAYMVLCFFPIAVEVKEVAVWKYSQSKI
ncbi:MAG: energy-coupling factor transporter transmembrane component T [Bacillota bacterium]|nr:energy-coupling factor transporter transmembrane component T [Bacillota bacterium]